MKAERVGNFPILQVRSEDNIVHMVHDETTVYIAIECTGQSLNYVHGIMRQVQAKNSWMPNFLPPTHYQQTTRAYLAVECYNRMPLSGLGANWYFIKAQVYISASKKWNAVSLYSTIRFKKLIWSILKTVLAFANTQIRPVLDVNSMFVSKDNNVIFSLYELRDHGRHDRNFEAGEIIKVLKYLVNSWAKTSDTIKAEFGALYKWLVSSTSPFHPQHQNGRLPPLDNALKNVVFWDCRTRISYIQLLGDFVIRDTVSIFPVAEHAFAIDNITNWRCVIEMRQNPVIMRVLELGDEYYEDKMTDCNSGTTSKPSFLRKRDISKYTPKDVLRSGVVRIRDSFYHIYKMKKRELIHLYNKSDLSDGDLQGMYQYIYPYHMVKLAEVQELTKFNAVEFIRRSFAQTQVEDVSDGLP